MYRLILFSLLFVFYSCSSDKSELTGDIERIPVETKQSTADASSFLEKIEIVPLETNDSSVTTMGRKVIYDRQLDMYVIFTGRQILYTFTGDGKYIANSRKWRGDGPQEYQIALDVQMNPYLKGIDVLTPSGNIYTYDYRFSKLIAKRNMPFEHFYDRLYPLDSLNYVFTLPDEWVNGEIVFGNLSTRQTVFSPYQGTIAPLTADMECFRRVEDTLYFVPNGLNYYIFRIDEKKKELIPALYLDFKEATVDEEGLPGCAAGKRNCSEAERKKFMKGISERCNYLRTQKAATPMVKLFNKDYVYVAFRESKSSVMVGYVYNRRTKEYFLSSETGKPFYMQICFALEDNVLMAHCYPHYLSMMVDPNLMSEEEKEKMEQVKEDDNPVIIKYYLKK